MATLKFDSVIRWFRTKKHVEITTSAAMVVGYIHSISHEGGDNIYILLMNTKDGRKEVCVRLL